MPNINLPFRPIPQTAPDLSATRRHPDVVKDPEAALGGFEE